MRTSHSSQLLVLKRNLRDMRYTKYVVLTGSLPKMTLNTLAAELLHGNSAGRYNTTFNVIMHYADFTHCTPPPVCWYRYVDCL